jgi:hypothetical protein
MAISHKDFAEKGKASTKARLRDFWWDAPQGDAHLDVFALAHAMEGQQATRRNDNSLHSMLYGERNGYDTPQAQAIAELTSDGRKGTTYNLIRSAVDTLSAKIAKAKPKASFVTDGGSWSQQRRAKRLDRFTYGAMHRAEAYATGRECFLDAAIEDLGAAKVFVDENGRFVVERVQPDELLVEEADGRYGRPRTLLHRRAVHREVLKALLASLDPDATEDELERRRAAIDAATPPGRTNLRVPAVGDFVEVLEAWHLPSGPVEDGKPCDGRHVVAVEGATLRDREWRRPRFPFAVLRFAKRRRGYYGQGIPERLAGRQRTINRKLRALNDSLLTMGVPRYFVRTGTQFSVEQLTNVPGTIMRGTEAPQVMQGVVGIGELVTSIQNDIREGLEEVGVSMLSASARKPGGLNSGASLREYNDIESERFILIGQAYEEFFVEVARLIIDAAREADEDGVKLEVDAEGRNGLERLAWKKVAMDEGTFVLKAFPTSSLPTTPSARKEAVQELLGAGFIDNLEARRLLDMPDLDASSNAAFAAQEDIEATVERFLEYGDDEVNPPDDTYQAPEPHQDLAFGLKRMQSAYLRAKWQSAPEARLQLLLNWMDQAQGLLDSLKAPPPAAAGPIPPGADIAPTGMPAGAPPPALPPGAPPMAA